MFLILVASNPENEREVYMKCKCFKSLKKNEDPLQLKVSTKGSDPV